MVTLAVDRGSVEIVEAKDGAVVLKLPILVLGPPTITVVEVVVVWVNVRPADVGTTVDMINEVGIGMKMVRVSVDVVVPATTVLKLE